MHNAAFVVDDPDLDGYAILDFDAFDEWREEDELLGAHARDPFEGIRFIGRCPDANVITAAKES